MAKITLNHLFETLSGKLCKKSSTYIALNGQTGKMYSAEYHGGTQPNTEAQQEVKSAFTTKARFAAAWWKANKPASAAADGTEAYQKVIKAYKAQTKIGNPYSYLRTLVTDDLKVMLGDTDITAGIIVGGGAAPSAPSGGGSASGDGVDVEG